MTATILKWVIITLAFMNFGYMTFDGAKALITGDYIRPQTGDYAGQLGPWTKLVEKIGVDPMSTFMKLLFVLFGLIGIGITVSFALNVSWAWKAMLIYNICSSWYLFFGTASSILQIILLFIIRLVR